MSLSGLDVYCNVYDVCVLYFTSIVIFKHGIELKQIEVCL